ncbi:hypothetical protein CC80DRAFT_415565 [Byssothecium circinans]|uniref:Uncharacterized protein n=1 Tax=Byssothecium circinans TaxID=147558 RepID=A0A6A5TRW6_9PLEO|nr:hypothetical protein CC80DRAFT_415565 [Byssothecium circinans]
MCYFDQTLFTCGDWKWGLMHQFCSKAPYLGEGCRMKLIWTTQYNDQKCRICCQIEIKKRRVRRLEERVRRWGLDKERWRASIELAKDDMLELNRQIRHQEMLRPIRQNSLR